MNKHLKIEVNGKEWVNGDFAEISFTDGPGGVKIEGKIARTPSNGSGGGTAGGLLEMLTNASRNRTNSAVEEKKALLAVEEPVEAAPVE